MGIRTIWGQDEVQPVVVDRLDVVDQPLELVLLEFDRIDHFQELAVGDLSDRVALIPVDLDQRLEGGQGDQLRLGHLSLRKL